MILNFRPFCSISNGFRDKNFCSSRPFWIFFLKFKIFENISYSYFSPLPRLHFWSRRPFWFSFIKFWIFENICYYTLISLVIPNFGPFCSISHRNRDIIYGQGGHFESFFIKFLKIFIWLLSSCDPNFWSVSLYLSLLAR